MTNAERESMSCVASPMLDPVARALLLRLAEDLDFDLLGPLGDALEEVGDVRAAAVRSAPTCLAREQCRRVLALFPEGPRWQLEVRKRGTAWRVRAQFEVPHDAEAALARYRHDTPTRTIWFAAGLPWPNAGLLWRVVGPLWPTPAG